MQQTSGPTILLIEANAALRRMIALGLQHRALHVIECDSLSRVSLVPGKNPALVVLDIDGEVDCHSAQLSEALEHPVLAGIPVIVLAWDAPAGIPAGQAGSITCLVKPFDARALHASIDDLLAAGSARPAVSRQEDYLASHISQPAPSLWPLLTAAGLLLLVTGLLFQVVISALGLLVALTALLLWTLGKKPEPDILLIEMR